MFISFATSKRLLQESTISCSASRTQILGKLNHFQITTSKSNRLRSQKINCLNHLSVSKSTTSTRIERYKSRNRHQPLLPHRSHRSNNPKSPVARRELKFSESSITSKKPHQNQIGFAPKKTTTTIINSSPNPQSNSIRIRPPMCIPHSG
jgi:hypothetical protein